MTQCVRCAFPAALVAAALTLIAIGARDASATEATPAATIAQGSRAPGAPAALSSRLVDHVWWNQPELVKALELRDDQRAQMDKLLARALDEERESQRKQMERRIAFEQALVKGDWGAARKVAADLRDGAGESMGPQTMLKVDVLALMDEGQRQTLVTQYVYLLRRPWVVASSMAGIPVRTPRGPIK